MKVRPVQSMRCPVGNRAGCWGHRGATIVLCGDYSCHEVGQNLHPLCRKKLSELIESFSAVLGIESRALHMLGKRSTPTRMESIYLHKLPSIDVLSTFGVLSCIPVGQELTNHNKPAARITMGSWRHSPPDNLHQGM